MAQHEVLALLANQNKYHIQASLQHQLATMNGDDAGDDRESRGHQYSRAALCSRSPNTTTFRPLFSTT